jgi:hypothetical protein
MPPPNKGITGLHWVRYGIAGDQKYLLGEFAETYDQLVVNANMVAHMPSAISQFLSQQLKKSFVIDPQTHAFQHEIDSLLSDSEKSAGSLKRSWKRLVERYGAPLDSVIGSDEPRSLLPDDLADNDLLVGFCKRVLLFQRDEITREIEEGEDADYIRFLAEQTGANAANVPPAMLIAPYFFIGGPLQDDWLALNSRCVEASRQIVNSDAPEIPLAAQVIISKELLSDKDLRTQVANTFLAGKPDVILLWIDGFSEQAASSAQLEHFVEFVGELSQQNTPVINLYGGFFSVAEARVGQLQGKLKGICHGLEYGESRFVNPVAGGVPVARFYSNHLHHRLPGRVAYTEIRALGGFQSVQHYHGTICDCPECKKVINKNPEQDFRAYIESASKSIFRQGRRVAMEFPTAEAADHCTRHYMWCKSREYRNNLVLADLKQQLLAAHTNLIRHVGSEFAAHAKLWAGVLQ